MTKKRIGIVLQGSRQWSGGIEYTRNLLSALRLQDGDAVELHLFTRGEVGPDLLKDLSQKADFVHACPSKWKFFTSVRKLKIDFLFPYYRTKRFMPKLAGAAWIPDFQHVHLPEFFSESDLRSRQKTFDLLANLGNTVILSSRSAETDFHQQYPANKNQTRVMHFHTLANPQQLAGNPSQVQATYHLPDRYFIVCNQFWAHKNHLLVLRSLKQLADRNIRPIVAMTGHPYDSRRQGFIDEFLAEIAQLGLHEQVRLLGLIPRTDQMHLIRRSIAVIQPSAFEGWSTVVEDSRCLGKRLILSDIAVHKEQNPPYVEYFQNGSVEDLATKMERGWAEYPVGPDVTAERKAAIQNQEDMRKFGARFLEIASEV